MTGIIAFALILSAVSIVALAYYAVGLRQISKQNDRTEAARERLRRGDLS